MVDINIDLDKPSNLKQAIVWHSANGFVTIASTGPEIYCLGEMANPFLNSGVFVCNSAFNKKKETSVNNSDRDYIKFEKQFEKQFELISEYFENISYEKIKSNFSLSLSELLRFKPNNFSLEMTIEKSVYYTLIKNDYLIFIHHYLDIQDAEDDEVIVTGFKNNDKLPSFAGNLAEAIRSLSNILYPTNEVKLWRPRYELSY